MRSYVNIKITVGLLHYNFKKQRFHKLEYLNQQKGTCDRYPTADQHVPMKPGLKPPTNLVTSFWGSRATWESNTSNELSTEKCTLYFFVFNLRESKIFWSLSMESFGIHGLTLCEICYLEKSPPWRFYDLICCKRSPHFFLETYFVFR